jgi:predicted ester cyclase
MSRRAALRRAGGGGAALATAAVLGSTAPASASQENAASDREGYVAIADGIIAALNGDNPNDLDQWVEPDAIGHVPLAEPGEGKALQWVKDRLELASTAFPDRTISVKGLIVEGNQISAHGIFEGTHEGPLQELSPTGGKLTVPWLAFVTVVDGKVTEYWYQIDALGALKQFGLFEVDSVTDESVSDY